MIVVFGDYFFMLVVFWEFILVEREKNIVFIFRVIIWLGVLILKVFLLVFVL